MAWPPLFALNNAVFSEKCKRIVESKGGRFERQALCFRWLIPFFFIVPLKPHRYTKCITRRMWRTGLASFGLTPCNSGMLSS